MKKQSWAQYVFWILFSEAAGALSGRLSREGIRTLNETTLQPSLSPPAIVFPIVWTILYGLMGISAARVSVKEPSGNRSLGLNLFVVQLVVNFFWSPIFFQAKAYGFALIWLLALWFLVFGMILSFEKTDKIASYLQIPYLLWLTFALYLNWGVWKLNP